jgi:hypothetical protein
MPKKRTLIAASHPAHATVVSLNGYRPTATVESAVIGIIVIASVPALTVTRSANINANTAGVNVHTLSKCRCLSCGSDCANESKRAKRFLNPHKGVLSVPS